MSKFEVKNKSGVPVMFQNRKMRVVLAGNKPKDLAEVIYRVIIGHEQTNFENSKRIQCYGGRKRSIGDTWRVAQSYIPGVTYRQVESAIKSLYHEIQKSTWIVIKAGLISPGYCYTTGRVVHSSASLIRGTEDNIRKDLENSKLNIKC